MNQAVAAVDTRSERAKAIAASHAGRLPDRMEEFARLMANGSNRSEAARLAGYASPDTEGVRLMKDSRVRAAIREFRERYIEGDMAGTALRTMQELMTDKENTPASVRFQAAKWTLEAAGHKPASGIDGLPDPNKNLAEMTLEELARFIQAGEQALQTIRNEPIDVTPEPTVSAFNAQDSAQVQGADPLEVADLLG